MKLLGIDVGSSSVKVSVVDGASGEILASTHYPKTEQTMISHKVGWAEQDPSMWWENAKLGLKELADKNYVNLKEIEAVGITYQMHGLVCIDKNQNVLRPSIIWCDSRAVEIGNIAFDSIGHNESLEHLLNSPGNFTASKLKWVKDNEPGIYEKIYKIMLPGDYIAMKLSGIINTTTSGLSEGIMWDFKENGVADMLLDHYGISKDLIPDIVDTFSVQSEVSTSAAQELGINAGIPISYRAGDQPNNAFSLNVLNPGEIAATAGTSGVVYGVSGEVKYDPKSRVNTFAHVNHGEQNRLGILLCVNGTGILNNWLNKNMGGGKDSYVDMNDMAAKIPIGSKGLTVLPFGNGAERMLGNKEVGAQISGIGFNNHTSSTVYRAAQEGIVFAFKYGMDIMQYEAGMKPSIIRAGNANMFLSPIFRDTLAGVTGAPIELYDTDGAVGAARGAGVGMGYYKSFEEAFSTLKKIKIFEPDTNKADQYAEAYNKWLKTLEKVIN